MRVHRAHAVFHDRPTLEESARLLPLIIESAREYAVFRADARGLTASWTSGAARLYGYRAEEILGAPCARYLPPEVAPPARLADAADGRIRLEGWSTRKDGSKFWSDVSVTALRDDEGTLLGCVIVCRDAAERAPGARTLDEESDELRRSHAELAKYAYMSSHDLSEPLHKVQAFAERLEEKLEGRLDEEGKDYLRRMLRAIGGMRDLVDAQLELSRVVTNGGPPAVVDLGTTAKVAVESLAPEIARSGAHVEIGSMPRIEADPLQMRLLLRHLLDNALKFRKPEGQPHVTLRGRETGSGRCEITVADDGIGFDMKHADRIFEPFQRLHPRYQYAGSGMGLAICRRIVERHGGTLSARSAPGRGAEFVADLPVSHGRRTECRSTEKRSS